MADCVMQQFKLRNVARQEAAWWIMDQQHEEETVNACACRSKYVPCNLLFNLLAHAYAVDGGEYIMLTKQRVSGFAMRVAAKMTRSQPRSNSQKLVI